MTTYRNMNFEKRDYETSNIVACVADELPASSDNRWIESTPDILENLTLLWIERGVRYYGYL